MTAKRMMEHKGTPIGMRVGHITRPSMVLDQRTYFSQPSACYHNAQVLSVRHPKRLLPCEDHHTPALRRGKGV